MPQSPLTADRLEGPGVSNAPAIPSSCAFPATPKPFLTTMRFRFIGLWRPRLAPWILPLLLWALPAAVVAQQTSDQYTYDINPDRTVVITGYTGPGGPVMIPSVIDGMPVTEIEFASTGNTN